MRKVLRAFLKWLDSRFPEKVVITQAQLFEMKEKLEVLSSLPSQEERLKRIEAEINKFNAHMGFGGTMLPKGLAQTFQR
jgi:hypothetical protein